MRWAARGGKIRSGPHLEHRANRAALAGLRIPVQLTDVIALPQRGQNLLRPEAQVVPQLEQVQQPEAGEVAPQA